MTGSRTTAAPKTVSTVMTQLAERRESVREACTGPLWWKAREQDRYASGWLIERSNDGFAFLIRGQTSLVPGTKILTSTSDPTDIGFHIEEGLVSRVIHVHADLFLIAAQIRHED